MEQFKTELQDIMTRHATQFAKLKQQQTDNSKIYAGIKLSQEQDAVDHKIMELKRDSAEKINQATERAKGRVNAMEANGKEVNQSDMMLLDPERVKLNQSEFDIVANRYAGNYTMRLALRTYAEKRGLKYDSNTNKADMIRRIDKISGSTLIALYSDGAKSYNVETADKLGGSIVF